MIAGRTLPTKPPALLANDVPVLDNDSPYAAANLI